jgi:membrane-bound lytic murein transglycosylase D
MPETTSTFKKSIALVWLFLLAIASEGTSQNIQIPNRVSLGGTIVNLDKGAQKIIEEDIQSLMSNTKFWEEKLERAVIHFPIVEKILMEEEVPIDFKYLAVQESSFKPDVISSSNAVGYWQLKAETAKELGLTIDNSIDERKNLSSSTHAAAWYLKKNNTQFNNWVSTLYSYYLGVGGVKKIIPDSWTNAREVTLTNKTDRYMLRFFAHKIALESGLEKYRSTSKLTLIESEYGKGLSLDQIATNLNLNIQDVKLYNRWLSADKVPSDREYLVILPATADNYTSVKANIGTPTAVSSLPQKNSVTVNSSAYPILKKSTLQPKGSNGAEFYDINGLPGILARPGDKAKTLANDGNLSTAKFIRYNDMVVDVPLVAGQVYYLARKNKKAATPYHTAQAGDTWQSVSQQYGIRLVNLLKYNRTTSKNYPIQTGQVLWLDQKRPKKQPVEIKKETTPTVPNKVTTAPAVIASQSVNKGSESKSNNQIPTNSSERKKYAPVLVESSETTTPATKPAESNVAVKNSTSTAPASKSSTTTYAPNDRVVIITQDNDDQSFRTNTESNVYAKKTESATYTAPKDKTPVKEPTANYTPAPSRPATKEPVARYVEPKSTAPAPVASTNAFHTVESGQTYFSISRMYNLTVDELLELNNLSDVKKLSVGQKLKVQKTAGSIASQTGGSKTAAFTGNPTTHTVASGETLFRISQNYGVSIESIQKLNNLSGNTVKLGQKLKIPAKN